MWGALKRTLTMKDINKTVETVVKFITRESFSIADVIIAPVMISKFGFPWFIFTWIGWIMLENLVRLVLLDKSFKRMMIIVYKKKKGGENDKH